MYSSKLPAVIDVQSMNNAFDIIDYLYGSFKNDFMDANSRPNLFGKFIYLDCKKWIDNKSESFWHLISLADDERFNILPCNNDNALNLCNNNCISPTIHITLSNGKKRNVCFYRGIRINWISNIITLANNRDSFTKVWRKKISINNTLVTQLYIRFQHDTTDYILIFEEKYKGGNVSHYYFVSAFPVFYINKKYEFDNDYEYYIRNIRN